MADIELVIKIPEGLKKDFELEQWTALSCMEMKDALMNGTLLPKGHGRLIDADKAIHDANSSHDIHGALWKAPTVDAIPKDQYEARLKADMVAMLTKLQLEISENMESIVGKYDNSTPKHDMPSKKIERNEGRNECIDLIQQKIDLLQLNQSKSI